MKKNKIIGNLIILSIISLIFISETIAATPPDTSAAMGRMNTFMQNVAVAIQNIQSNTNLIAYVDAEWNAFTIILLVIALAKWNFGGISVYDIINTLLLVLVARIMLNNYDMLTTICWDWSEGIAGAIQTAVVGNSDPFFLAGFIEDAVAGISTSDVGLLDGLRIWFCSLSVLVIVFALSILSFLASTWALYGYALAKMIGWFFIPCIMIKRLSFFFDGWIRLFTGFLIYGIVARANLILTVLAVKSFFGIPGYVINTTQVYRFDFTGIADLFGLAGFLLISILALISTGRFASSIVSSAGGFGQSLTAFAYAVTRAIKAI